MCERLRASKAEEVNELMGGAASVRSLLFYKRGRLRSKAMTSD